jgi:hypothetical protein
MKLALPGMWFEEFPEGFHSRFSATVGLEDCLIGTAGFGSCSFCSGE